MTDQARRTYVLPDGAVGAKFSDTLAIGQRSRLLFLGDNWSGGVDVFSLEANDPKYVKTIPVRRAVYGMCVAEDLEKLFVAAQPSGIAVVDLREGTASNLQVIERIDLPGTGHSDLVDYDPVHHRLFVANRNDAFLAVIDAHTHRVIGIVDNLGPGLEQPLFNPNDEMVYLTSNVANVLYQIDPSARTLRVAFSIEVPCNPNGMALNAATNLGMFASSDRRLPNTVVWDFAEQSVAKVIEGCGLGDGVSYVASIDRFLLAAHNNPSGPALGIFSGSPIELLTTTPTDRRASWVAIDERTLVAYLPTVVDGKPALLGLDLGSVPGALPPAGSNK